VIGIAGEEGDMTRHATRALTCLLAAVALAAPACSDDGGGTVDVTLQEFAVVPSESSVDAGEVTFEATNDGPGDPHELVVIQTDLAIDALPTDENGAVDEAGEGITVLDEIEEFPPGETQSLTLDLDAGSYVLICNIWDEDEQESHYQEGMRVALTVS
jgi:uncharacterized cupredoxin-like copper-binding protein